jgi:hypothetical protein
MRDQLKKLAPFAVSAFAVVATVGCNSTDPPEGSPARKAGSLGNVDFVFSCADTGAACLPYSGDAAKFPDRIATGSTFDVRVISKDQPSPSIIVINEHRYEGITIDGVSPYFGRGVDGLVAKQPGIGTLIVHDSAGTVIDFVPLTIVQPKTLLVYDANYNSTIGKEPPRVSSAKLKVGDTQGYRVVGEADSTATSGGSAIAGSFPVEWTSSDDKIVSIDGYDGGVVNLRANAVGTVTLTADGAGIRKTLEVEVTQ